MHPRTTSRRARHRAAPPAVARLVPALLALACLTAPTAAAQSAARRSNVVTVVARDFAFELPDSIPAGLTTFRLLNRGKQVHHLGIMRLDQGRTPADGIAALVAAGMGRRPAWMHPVGGPNHIMPGADANATLVLEPGTYLAYCEVPGPDPSPHFMKGMMKGFVVTAASTASGGPSPAVAVLPEADLTVTLGDYAFTLSHPLTSGHHVVAVTNTSRQPHMLVINRYRAGEDTKGFLAWAADPRGKPAPAEAFGGVTTIAPGATVVFEHDFPPGRYALLCFTPDATDGRPHIMHGMQREIVVR